MHTGSRQQKLNITGPALIGVREIAAAANTEPGKTITVVAAAPDAPPVRGFGGPSLAVVTTAIADLTTS